MIWRQSPKVSGSGHFSHRIAFAPDGTMFLSSGERQKFTPAQDMTGNLGKILHLTDEGPRPPGIRGPTAAGLPQPTGRIGHRNALGLVVRARRPPVGVRNGARRAATRSISSSRARITAGRGPRTAAITTAATSPTIAAATASSQPKVWWNPSISPGALMIYTGDLFPQWKGDALIGALSGEALIRVDIDGDKARKADQWPMGARIRAVDQGPRGEIYLLEDGDSGGRLLRLTPKRLARRHSPRPLDQRLRQQVRPRCAVAVEIGVLGRGVDAHVVVGAAGPRRTWRCPAAGG